MRKRTWSNKAMKFVVPCMAFALAACGNDTPTDASRSGGGASNELGAVELVPVMGPERTIIAFGDSLFAGYGLADGESYPDKLQSALRTRGINAMIANAGISGDTSAAGLQRLAFTLDAQESAPDLFILELGGNDLLRSISPEQTRANLSAMLGELKARNVPVLIMGMRAPPNLGPEYQQEFDGLYGDLAAEFETALIPFWLEDIFQEPDLFQADRIHPTAEGIERLVTATIDDVAAALPEDEAEQAEGAEPEAES
ncbi:MAG: arylesterase [Erythrobacter sp.]